MSDSSGSFSISKIVFIIFFVAAMIFVAKLIYSVTMALVKWAVVSMIILTVVGYAFRSKKT